MSFVSLDPAIQKYNDKKYSIEPDRMNGWKGKNIPSKQIPLVFYHQFSESIVDNYHEGNLTKKLIYLGPRYSTNIRAISQYSSKSSSKFVKQSCVYNEQQLQKYSFKFDNMMQEVLQDDRPFVGMNKQYLKSNSLKFDSDFQCGNLDLVLQKENNQYDLFMRVDSNTKGHFSWFFFKVTCKEQKKVKFNICNFYKQYILYSKGMKPYVFDKFRSEEGWRQHEGNVKYTKNSQYSFPQSKTFAEQSEVWFVYSIPYSYSYLLNFITSLESNANNTEWLKVDTKYKTPSGLKIPVITIGIPQPNKRTIILTGRMHPGQTQGSWMIHNFIKFLCSQQAHKIRQEAVYKIIPMVNVDGVVIGNFRTNIKGSDVNRQFNFNFKAKQNTQSYCVRQTTFECSSNTIAYLDFHGHSTRKGVFIYGPQYSINQQQYYTCRIYPKILALSIDMFRYYSCVFRITQSKKYTARAAMFKHYKIPYVFTIQASTHSYINSTNEQILFSQKLYEQMGQTLCFGLQQTIPLYLALQERKQALKKIKQTEIQVKLQKRGQQSLKSLKQYSKEKKTKSISPNPKSKRFKQQNKLPKGLTQLCQKFSILASFMKEIKSQKNTPIVQSDRSDCESDDQNYTKQQLRMILNKKKKQYAKSLVNIRKIAKSQIRKEFKKEDMIKEESKPRLVKNITSEQGFVGKIISSQNPLFLVKKIDVEGQGLPTLSSQTVKHIKAKQKLGQRNKTLEAPKCRPAVYECSPLSHRPPRSHKNSSLTDKSQYEQKLQRIQQVHRHVSFPWLQPNPRFKQRKTDVKQIFFKIGAPSIHNKIIQTHVRRDYIRRKTNRSYQLTNLSLDLYHK